MWGSQAQGSSLTLPQRPSPEGPWLAGAAGKAQGPQEPLPAGKGPRPQLNCAQALYSAAPACSPWEDESKASSVRGYPLLPHSAPPRTEAIVEEATGLGSPPSARAPLEAKRQAGGGREEGRTGGGGVQAPTSRSSSRAGIGHRRSSSRKPEMVTREARKRPARRREGLRDAWGPFVEPALQAASAPRVGLGCR